MHPRTGRLKFGDLEGKWERKSFFSLDMNLKWKPREPLDLFRGPPLARRDAEKEELKSDGVAHAVHEPHDPRDLHTLRRAREDLGKGPLVRDVEEAAHPEREAEAASKIPRHDRPRTSGSSVQGVDRVRLLVRKRTRKAG